MLNAIPIFGWFLSVAFAISLAVPFWFLWTVCGYGATYAYWLPNIYLHPGFWDCVCIFILMSIIHAVFIPKFASATAESKKD